MPSTTIQHLRKVPIMRLVLGFVLFCFGIFGALFTNVFLLVLSGFGVFLMLKEGSQIDLAAKHYREIYSVLGVNFGKWKPFPKIEYVSVFKTRESKRVQGLGASANFSNDVYKINLFYNRNQKIEAYITDDSSDAFENAKYIAEILSIDILDATKSPSKWLT